MLEPNKKTITVTKASPMPIYIVAVVWLVGTLFLKMYKLSSYLILAVVSSAVYMGVKLAKLFPDNEETMEVNEPLHYYNEVQQQFLEDGMKYVNSILETVKKLDNTELKKNVDRLANASSKIFDYVYENGKSATNLRKLVNYYLPTIDKLLKRYIDLDDDTSLANVNESREKIVSIVATTAAAFEKQYSDLFDNDTLDINAEVKVLENILVQEGLTDLNK